MNRKFWGLVIFGGILATIALLLQSQNWGTTMLWKISHGGQWLLPLLMVSAVIDSINPCAFSILLVTIAFLVGLGKNRPSILKIGGFYILGILAVYMLIGLGILQVLHLFNTPHFMAKVGAWLLLGLGGINLVNQVWPNFPVKLRIPQAVHHRMAMMMEKISVPTAFLLGALVGLCEFPCTGGPYLMVLGLLHDQGTYLKGLGYLLLYNLIFILPLVILLFLASNAALLQKVRAWQQQERIHARWITGMAMIVLGLLILWL